MMLAFRILFVAAALSGIVLYKKLRSLERFERTVASIVPALVALFAIEVAELILAAPYELLDDMRITRTFAIFGGVNLYPGNNATGAIIGTLHPPVSHILFWPAIFAKTPALAMEIGSVIAFALFFAPISASIECAKSAKRPDFVRAKRFLKYGIFTLSTFARNRQSMNAY